MGHKAILVRERTTAIAGYLKSPLLGCSNPPHSRLLASSSRSASSPSPQGDPSLPNENRFIFPETSRGL
jgi:hypothetical protein